MSKSNLLTTIQSIAVNAVNSTSPTVFCYGTVTNADPLKIRLSDSTIEISGNSIILTEPVVEKKITIKKHTHKIGSTIASHTHMLDGECTQSGKVTGTALATKDFDSDTEIVDTVLDAQCTEFGKKLSIEKDDDDEIIFIINEALKKNDKVVMLRVSSGQRFIVLSRIFTRSDETD